MTMWLSRLLLNPLSRNVRRDMSNVVEMHRTVMRGFPAATPHARRAHNVLYRLEVNERRGRVELLVQSSHAPDWSGVSTRYLIETDEPNPAVKSLDSLQSCVDAGREFMFRLRANPTKRVTVEATSRRVELRGDAERIAWLKRKGVAGGFVVLCDDAGVGVSVQEERKSGGPRSNGTASGRITVLPVLFDGRLRVLDAEQFKRTLCEGIGPAKAYGCGLLSLGP